MEPFLRHRRKESLVSSVTILLTSFIVSIVPTTAQIPPRLAGAEPHRVALAGSTVHLPCPVTSSPGDPLYFEWFVGSTPLGPAGERFRVAGSGALRIRAAEPEDSGLYVCRAVNGFGSLLVNVTLIVLDTSEYPEESKDQAGLEGIEVGKPRLSSLSPQVPLQRSEGNGAKLRCQAEANPRPRHVWLKDGHPLSGRTRPVLYLHNLRSVDSGNYTCLVFNVHGSVNATFSLQVTDRVAGKPELTGHHPLNTTVAPGEEARFQCRVRSEVSPHVQWLKEVDAEQAREDPRKVIQVQNEYFRILPSSEIKESPDGSFLSTLLVSQARETDSGKYICLGANSVGYSFRSAFLTVLPEASPESPAPLSMSLPILVSAAVGGSLLLIGTAAVLFQCRRRPPAVIPPRPYMAYRAPTEFKVSAPRLYIGDAHTFGPDLCL